MTATRTNYSPAVGLLAATALLLLAGYEVPYLTSVTPDLAQQGEQNFQLTLSGNYFDSGSRLVIDGSPEGTGTDINLVALSLVSPTQIVASLQISPNAARGPHYVAVGDEGGISEPKLLYVTCPGCPPPPRLFNLVTGDLLQSGPLYRGQQSKIRLQGQDLQSPDTIVSISGDGLIFNPHAIVEAETPERDFIDLPISVAADAPTGVREVRVHTDGGTSSPRLLTIMAEQQIPLVTAVTVSGSTPCALRRGWNDLYVTGNYFDVGTAIRIDFVAEGQVFQLLGTGTSLQDSRTIFTQVYVDSDVPDSFSVIATAVGGESTPFPVSCNPESRPILRSLSPAVVTRGTEVFVKCEGENFHRGDPETHQQQVLLETAASGGGGAHLLELYQPNAANEERMIVAKLRIDATGPAESSVVLWVRNQLGQLSNPLTLKIVQPPPRYYISKVTPNFITQGTNTEITVEGNFIGISDYQFFRFSTPGLTLSNPKTDPNSLFKIRFDVHADADATLTNDEATNLLLANPIAFQVLPSNGPPVPTPTPIPTPTPSPTSTPSSGGPVISNITPARIGKGVEVLIKCEGSGFGTSRQVITDPPLQTTTYGVASAAADPDRVVVAKLRAAAAGPLKIRVRNLTTQTTSAEFILFVDDPAPGVPVAQGATGDGVHRGGGFDLTVFGSNLQGITDSSWSGIPGLSFSNTTYSSGSATVHIEADGSAPLTADEATNLRITTPAGQSPPFLFRVFQ